MVLCEDGDCSVCLLPYSRVERIPRVLHCRHTFCDSCLERMSTERNGLLTVGCPLCRRVTCIGRGRGLREALWVNSKLWDQIPEDVDVREEEEEEDGEKQTASARAKLKLPTFFRRFSLTKQHQERIVSGSNEMKSWRRLSTEETF
uniref:Im:7152348 n=1 Tax=Haplochromis burtoni TaxID=8153 RepID=A0A3Q2X224_HAPBU